MRLYRPLLFTAAGLLLIATLAALSLPYGYFTFLRIMVCGVAVYTAFQQKDHAIALICLLMAAVLFNPFIPVHLPQSTWRVIDLATAAGFLRLALSNGNAR